MALDVDLHEVGVTGGRGSEELVTGRRDHVERVSPLLDLTDLVAPVSVAVHRGEQRHVLPDPEAVATEVDVAVPGVAEANA